VAGLSRKHLGYAEHRFNLRTHESNKHTRRRETKKEELLTNPLQKQKQKKT
jgi:hypothetical protein